MNPYPRVSLRLRGSSDSKCSQGFVEQNEDTPVNNVVFVPTGTRHNFVNTGDEDLKLYTVYAPPAQKDEGKGMEEYEIGLIGRQKKELDSQELIVIYINKFFTPPPEAK